MDERLTESELQLLPSEDDIRFYREHGFYFSKKIFDDEELDQAIAAQDHFYKSGPSVSWPGRIKAKGWTKDDLPELRQNDYISFQEPFFKKLLSKPLLGEIAARLTGEPVRLWQDHLSFKEPHSDSSVRGWHNDRQYWKACSSLNMTSAWIPLTDVDESMGTITYLDGSNRWEPIDGLNYFSTNLEDLEKEIKKNGHAIRKVPAILKRGQVAFHQASTIHGSGPNHSSKARRAYGVHMQPISNQPVPNAFHFNKMLCSENGKINYADPFWFPLLGEICS